MQDAIVATNLRRTFRHYEKQPGFLATLKSVVWRTWQETAAVDGIDFRIAEGEFVGLLGPNGAGKTTTLKMLSGILTPTSGSCNVLGFFPHHRKRTFKKQIALVMGQKSQLIWDLPPQDTFVLHRDLYEIGRAEWNDVLATLTDILRVGHVLSTPVRQLSLGERMKCELIVALLHRPRVLFLDEPTIGLDVLSQVHLWEFLGTYQKKHAITTILTSHHVQDIANLCKRVIILQGGHIAFDGLLDTLINRMEPERSGVVRLRQHEMQSEHAGRIAQMVKDRHLEQIDPLTYRIRMPRGQFPEATEWFLHNLPVEEMRMEEVNLTRVIERAFTLETDDSE